MNCSAHRLTSMLQLFIDLATRIVQPRCSNLGRQESDAKTIPKDRSILSDLRQAISVVWPSRYNLLPPLMKQLWFVWLRSVRCAIFQLSTCFSRLFGGGDSSSFANQEHNSEFVARSVCSAVSLAWTSRTPHTQQLFPHLNLFSARHYGCMNSLIPHTHTYLRHYCFPKMCNFPKKRWNLGCYYINESFAQGFRSSTTSLFIPSRPLTDLFFQDLVQNGNIRS